MMLTVEMSPRASRISPADVNRDVSGSAVLLSDFDFGGVNLNYFSIVGNDQV